MCGSGHFRVIVFSITTEEKEKVILFPFRLLLAGRRGGEIYGFWTMPFLVNMLMNWRTAGLGRDNGTTWCSSNQHHVKGGCSVDLWPHDVWFLLGFFFFKKCVFLTWHTAKIRIQIKLISLASETKTWICANTNKAVMTFLAGDAKWRNWKKKRKKKAWTSCVLFEALQILWRYAADPIHSWCMLSSHTVSKAEEIIWWSVAWSTTSASTPRDSYSEGTLLISPSPCRWIPPMSTNFNEFSWTRIAFLFIQTIYSNQCSIFVLCFLKKCMPEIIIVSNNYCPICI